MDRTIYYTQEQLRSFDVNSMLKDPMMGIARLVEDLLGGQTTVVSKSLNATATGTLAITLGSGRIYTLTAADATQVAGGALPADSTQIMQQGHVGAQSLTLQTTGLSAGQSRYALIQAGFAQADAVRSGDPTSGLLNFYNTANPSQPLNGQGNNAQVLPTVRQAVASITVKYGLVATTGSEVPPTADSGFVPLYLIDLAFGQTVVNQGQILTAGPSVGTNVPSNYPYAPILAGMLNSHHNGTPGQSNKIDLTTEVTGRLPLVNLPSGTRISMNADTTIFVRTTGSDSNNGLASGQAFLTLTHAWQYILATYDLEGIYKITVDFAAAGTFAGLVASGEAVGQGIGRGSIIFNGGGASSIISGGAIAVSASEEAAFTLQNCSLVSSGGNGIEITDGGRVLFNNLTFGTCAGSHMYVHGPNSFIETPSSAGVYTINGNATSHLLATGLACVTLQTPTVTLTGTPAFSGNFAQADFNGLLRIGGTTWTGSATGNRASAVRGGGIDNAGAGSGTLPGNAAGPGATSPGWIY